MPEHARPLAAVHYYYLLKNDDEDLRHLWMTLTGDEEAGNESPAASDLPELGLDVSGDKAGRCRIVHDIDGPLGSFRLCQLPDLSVVEIDYRHQGEPLEDEWRRVAEVIEADRDRLLSGLNGVFGETTLLIAAAGNGYDTIVKAADVTRGTALQTQMNAGPAGAEPSLLVHFPDLTDDNRDHYALASDDPPPFSETLFPEVDSLIKKLNRTASYFEIQRQTIIGERADVDRRVGELLHRQVVSENSVETETAALEEHITSLSRLFGLLATDSLLVRQSSDGISRDIKLLNRELSHLANSGSADEIGGYYLSRYNLDLAEAHAEIRNLDFSRQNAQAAIEVVRTQVEIMRAGEEAAIQKQSKELLSSSLVLQEERLALQVAAGFIEFVLVFYYVMKSWEGIAGVELVEHISALIRLAVIGGFSGSAALGTHYLAQAIQHRSLKSRGLWTAAVFLVLSLAGMVVLTVINS